MLNRIGKLWARALAGLVLIIAFTAHAVSAQSVEVSVEPNPVAQNEAAQIVLTLGNAELVATPAFPKVDGITWRTNNSGQQTSIVNGRVSHSVMFGMTVSKTGTLTIPSFTIETSRGKMKTTPFSFTVGKRDSGIRNTRGEAVDINDVVFLRLSLENPTPDNRYYVGQSLTLLATVYYRADLPIEMSAYPVIENSSAFATQTYELQTGRQLQFDPTYRQGAQAIDGQNYRVMQFSTVVRPIKTGRQSLFVNATALYQRRDSRSFFGYSQSPVPLEGALTKLEILPLPPPPADVYDLGMISTHMPTYSLSTRAPVQGETFTLDLALDGNPFGLKLPDFKCENFRAFPSENITLPATNNVEHTRVRIPLIPLKEGEQHLSGTFALFNPATGRYMTLRVDEKLNVAPGKNLIADAVAPAIELPPEIAREKDYVKPSGILNIVPVTLSANGTAAQDTPSLSHALILGLILALVGLLALVINELLLAADKRHRLDPDYARKMRAKERRSHLIDCFSHSNADNFDALVRTELCDYIADTKGYPCGEDAAVLSEKIKNKELGHVLENAQRAGYCPGQRCADFDSARKTVLKALKHSLFIFMALATLQTLQADEISTADSTPQAVLERAAEAYYASNFEQARDDYRRLTAQEPFNAGLAFNLGNCYYQLRDYPRALWCYERAHRLDPVNSDYLSNLNAACARLDLPPRQRVRNPLDFMAVLRDTLPLSGHFTLAGAALLLGAILVIAGRRKQRMGYWLTGLIIALVIGSIGVFNGVWQNAELYNRNEAIVLVPHAQIWSLPGTHSARMLGTLPGGASIRIEEQRADRYRFRDKGTDAWINKADVGRILPE